MKSAVLGFCFSLGLVASALAADDPAPKEPGNAPPASSDTAAHIKAMMTPKPGPILRAKDTEQVNVYEWTRDGKRYNAWPWDKVKPPKDADYMKLRMFSAPNGRINELKFFKGSETPSHTNYEDNIKYEVSGRIVQFVNGKSAETGPGDVAYHPKGVQHNSKALTDATQLEFAFDGPAHEPPEEGVWLMSKDVPEVPLAAWVRDKKQIVARGADIANAPPDAIKYTTKTFKFPHYTLVEAHVPKGTESAPRIDDDDGLIYFLKGKFHVDIGGVVGDVGPGDVLYEAAGTEHHFKALEDTVFVKIATPPAAKGDKAAPH